VPVQRSVLLLVCLLAVPLGARSRAHEAGSRQPAAVLDEGDSSGLWRRYHVEAGGRRISFYAAHDGQPKPLVVLVHGSGCAPVMTVDGAGAFRDTTLFQDVVTTHRQRFHFAIVEKRGVVPLRFTAGMTREARVAAFERVQRPCSAQFDRDVTKTARVDDVVAVVHALGGESWVSRVILVGHSEGTHVVTGVLAGAPRSPIAAAGLFASAGPLRHFAGYAAQGPDPGRLRRLVDEVQMLQSAPDDTMHDGLPVRRWRTFWLDSTRIDDIRQSHVPLFVTQGTRDGTTLAADLFVLEALRQQPTRPVRYVVVAGGDHAFETEHKGSRIAELFVDFMDWATSDARRTAVHVLPD
jgi:pimeloyl-ACP methyl ester carboxylesterase